MRTLLVKLGALLALLTAAGAPALVPPSSYPVSTCVTLSGGSPLSTTFALFLNGVKGSNLAVLEAPASDFYLNVSKGSASQPASSTGSVLVPASQKPVWNNVKLNSAIWWAATSGSITSGRLCVVTW